MNENPLLTHLDCCGNTGLSELDITPCSSLVADYLAGGRHISWMQEAMPEQYESIWVYGGTGDEDYNLAVNDYTIIIVPTLEPDHTPGDISGDGKIDAADCALLLRIGTFRHTKEQAQHASADLSGDGIIDIVDYAILTDSDRFGKDKSMCIVSHAA